MNKELVFFCFFAWASVLLVYFLHRFANKTGDESLAFGTFVFGIPMFFISAIFSYGAFGLIFTFILYLIIILYAIYAYRKS